MKKREYFYKMLTRAEKRRFRKAMHTQHEKFHLWVRKECDSFEDFILRGFFWDGTQEGHDYWSVIMHKYKDVK